MSRVWIMRLCTLRSMFRAAKSKECMRLFVMISNFRRHRHESVTTCVYINFVCVYECVCMLVCRNVLFCFRRLICFCGRSLSIKSEEFEWPAHFDCNKGKVVLLLVRIISVCTRCCVYIVESRRLAFACSNSRIHFLILTHELILYLLRFGLCTFYVTRVLVYYQSLLLFAFLFVVLIVL